MAITRDDARDLDGADPLARFRSQFVIDEDGAPIYLVGNSLGRLPRATIGRLATVVEDEWGRGLVGSWWDSHWLELPATVGDRLAPVVGAAPGEVVLADSTTVNLYKLCWAAARPGCSLVVTDAENFPTDRYALAGLASATGRRYVEIARPDVWATIDPDDVAVASFSLVDYRTSELFAVPEVSAPVVWDLSHAAGIVPIPPAVSLAVGCTYKYLNGGPGSPAFVLVRDELAVPPPIWGWFAQRDQFAMGPMFDPQDDIRRFLVGTPPILSLAAADEAIGVVAGAGIDAIREKSVALTSLLVELADEHGLEVASPRDPDHRGGHVALRHVHARRLEVDLAERAGVLVDYREPDVLRLAPAPLYTRFVDVWEAMHRVAQAMAVP